MSYRFPKKSLLDSFYVFSMGTINFEDLNTYGNKEILKPVSFLGEKQVYDCNQFYLIIFLGF